MYYFKTRDTQFWQKIYSNSIHGAKIEATKETENYEEVTIASKNSLRDYDFLFIKYPYSKKWTKLF